MTKPTFEDHERWYEKKYKLLRPLENLAGNLGRRDWETLLNNLQDKAYADELEAFMLPLLEEFFHSLIKFRIPDNK